MSSFGSGQKMPAFPLIVRRNLARHIQHVRWACLVHLAGTIVGPVAMGLENAYLQWCIENGVRPTHYPFREAAVFPLLLAAAVVAGLCTVTHSAHALGTSVAPVLRWAVLVVALLMDIYAWGASGVSVADRPLIIAISLLNLLLLLYVSRLAEAAGKRLLAMLAWVAAIPEIVAMLVLCTAEGYAHALTSDGLVLLWFTVPTGYLALWVWRTADASSAILKADARLRFIATRSR